MLSIVQTVTEAHDVTGSGSPAIGGLVFCFVMASWFVVLAFVGHRHNRRFDEARRTRNDR